MAKLEELKRGTLFLQGEKASLAYIRLLFDTLITGTPDFDFSRYIGPTSEIVQSTDFETAIVKIQMGKEVELTDNEKDTVACLLKNDQSAAVSDDDKKDVYLRMLDVLFIWIYCLLNNLI